MQVYEKNVGLILELDGLTGEDGVEEVLLAVDEPASFILRAFGRTESTASVFEVHVTSLRRARAEDRRRASAWLHFSAAEISRQRPNREDASTVASHYLEAAQLWSSVGESLNEARAYFERGGFCQGVAGQRDWAIVSFQQAAILYREAGDEFMEARSRHELGKVFRQLSKLELASDSLEAALDFWRTSTSRIEEATVLHDLALVWAHQGRFHEAIEGYMASIGYYQDVGLRQEEARARTNLGYLYMFVGERRQAALQYRRALRLLGGPRDVEYLALALLRLGDVLLLLEGPESALESYRRAQGGYQEIGDIEGQALVLNSMGKAHRSAQRPPKAVEALRLSREFYRSDRNFRGEATVASNLAAAYEDLGHRSRAYSTYLEALKLAEATGADDTLTEILHGLARVENSLGKTEAAISRLRRAIRLIESLRKRPRRIDQRSSYFAIRQDLFQFMVELLLQAENQKLQEARQHEAFEFAERSRSRGFIDSVPKYASKPPEADGVQSEARLQLRRLAERINALHFERLMQGQSVGNSADRTESLEFLLEEYQQRRAGLDPQSSRLSEVWEPPWTAKEIQSKVLDPGTLLLEYFLGSERSYLWAVTQDDISLHELPGSGSIDQLVLEARERLMLRPNSIHQDSLQITLAELSQALLGPVAEDLERFDRLVIVPSGSLNALPFAPLPDPLDPRSPLVASHEIVFLPSATALGELRRARARQSTGVGVGVLSDPAYLATSGVAADGYFGRPRMSIRRLANSVREADAILSLAPEGPVLDARRFEANLELVRSGALSGYQFLHFAVHGLFDDDLPELSALILSTIDEQGRGRDGLLRAYELHSLHLSAELVTLSACNSARGEGLRGEAVTGLAGGFFSAGAGGVLMSLTPVHDVASSELMERFYRHLFEDGEPASRALHLAQRSMWLESEWPEPYFWGAFVLYGDWRREPPGKSFPTQD